MMNDFSRFVWRRREKILSRGWTASCVAPRHVEASRNFDCISFERAAWGGGWAARLSLFVFSGV